MSSSSISVSIIVPLFNACNNLSHCIESLISQNLKSIEIIIVDAGSDTKLIETCNTYAQKDKRINIVSEKFSSIGAACNKGLKICKGCYVGFVLPNDWIEPEMYESMLEQALKYDTDVVKAFHYEYINEENCKNINMDIIWGKENLKLSPSLYKKDPGLLNKKILNKFSVPKFYLEGPYTWDAIYKTVFLKENKITFYEEQAHYDDHYDLSFSFLVFYYMSSIFIVRSSLYHHNMSIDIKMTKNEDYNKYFNMLNQHIYILELINTRQIPENYFQLEIARSFSDIKKNLGYCNSYKERFSYLKRAAILINKYIPLYASNVYLTTDEKGLLIQYALHPLRLSFFNKNNLHIKILNTLLSIRFKRDVSYIRVFGFPLLFIKNTEQYKTFNLLKIPIKRRKIQINKAEGIVKFRNYYFWLPISKKIITPNVVENYLLGILIRTKINIEAKLEKIQNSLDHMPNQDDMLFYSSISNSVAQAHRRVFPQFKGANHGKSLAIYGAGPTLNFAPQVENVITIACNRSIEHFKEKGPDYFFGQDYLGIKSFYDDAVKKSKYAFIGRAAIKNSSIALPEELRNRHNIYTYYYHTWFYDLIRIKADIENFPLADFRTIIHPALHFALYTEPDKIYLIGCDTSEDGYANKNILQFHIHVDNIKGGYNKFREFRDSEFPNTRIISVNPVGLKGIFEDVYTDGFLKEKPNIDRTKVTVINKISST